MYPPFPLRVFWQNDFPLKTAPLSSPACGERFPTTPPLMVSSSSCQLDNKEILNSNVLLLMVSASCQRGEVQQWICEQMVHLAVPVFSITVLGNSVINHFFVFKEKSHGVVSYFGIDWNSCDFGYYLGIFVLGLVFIENTVSPLPSKETSRRVCHCHEASTLATTLYWRGSSRQ